MPLLNQIQQDTITAMKAKDAETVQTLRMLSAAVKNKQIEDRSKKWTNDATLSVVQAEVKKRRDALHEYEQAGRNDLADKEKGEIDILEKYLPVQLSDRELDLALEDTIREIGDMGNMDFGAVMKAIMPKVQGKADGTRVSAVVKRKLAHE